MQQPVTQNREAGGAGEMTRLMFVDDEPFVLDALRRLLNRRRPDWDLAFAESGADALDEMKGKQFDVVVTDMRMPGMDGAELLDRVREHDPGIVRVILSGQSDRDAALRAVKVAHQFLAKPFDPPELEVALDRICGLNKLLLDPALRDLVGGVTSLPSTPRIYSMLVEQLSRPETSLDEVSGDTQAGSGDVRQSAPNGAFRILWHPTRHGTDRGCRCPVGIQCDQERCFDSWRVCSVQAG